MDPVVAHGLGSWMWLFVPVSLYVLITVGLALVGRSNERDAVLFFIGRVSDSLRRATGFPGWSMAGVLSALMALLIVVIGFYWDVAWHIDNGRDVVLFTPSHTMILVGLGGLVYAAVVAILFATVDDADVGFSAWGLRIPYSAVPSAPSRTAE
jgi:predicted permease